MRLFTFVLTAAISLGQDAGEVQRAVNHALATTAAPITITASQGDGTSLIFTKRASITINFGYQVKNAAGQVLDGGSVDVAPTGQSMVITYGDVTCLVYVNPGTAAVTVGSLGSVPASSLAYACSTNIRSSGAVTGQTAIVSGTIAWP